jgi:hypothetical protein
MMGYRMKRNQLVTTKSTSLILGKSKSLMGITKKILEAKSKELTAHEGITIIGDLMWEKESREMNWDDAMEYAKNLRLGGYSNWRLPTREELAKIVKLCGGMAIKVGDDNWEEIIDKNADNKIYGVNYYEKGFSHDEYWSSTIVGNSGNAWYLYFYFGGQDNDYGIDKSPSYYVRCVRDEQ